MLEQLAERVGDGPGPVQVHPHPSKRRGPLLGAASWGWACGVGQVLNPGRHLQGKHTWLTQTIVADVEAPLHYPYQAAP